MPSRPDRQRESVLDRIEDRLRDSAEGFLEFGEPASRETVLAAGLDPDNDGLLWTRWDGLDLAGGLIRVAKLQDFVRGVGDETLLDGDVVVGEQGRDRFVIPADPWSEGAEVVRVEEDGQRVPHASSVERWILAELAELSIVFDAEGEYRDAQFGEDGEASPEIERKICRRRLDMDPDAPFPRFRLAQLLRRAGEVRGAAAELRQVLRRAPEWCWAHLELGRATFAEGKQEAATRAFLRAAETAQDQGLREFCLAWQCRSTTDVELRTALAQSITTLSPELPMRYAAAARESLEEGDSARAHEWWSLGLALAPRNLDLLALRGPLKEAALKVAATHLFAPLRAQIEALKGSSSPTGNAARLDPLVEALGALTREGRPLRLLFVCAHNSRRSQIARAWAYAAAAAHGVIDVEVRSGGTAPTRVDPRALAALERAGFSVSDGEEADTPIRVCWMDSDPGAELKSERWNGPLAWRDGFVAVMTCAEADSSCPHVPGSIAKISLPYDDPRLSDDTEDEERAYDACCGAIGTDLLEVFSRVSITRSTT